MPRTATKGSSTRSRIVTTALEQASRDGLSALTIGGLAEKLGMSKSGLFAHFGSKEALQRGVIEQVFADFRDKVAKPALAVPPGKAQLKALLERWVAWSYDPAHRGGCPLMGAIFDFDGQPGEIRAMLAEGVSRWHHTLVDAARQAKDVDLPQSADEAQIADAVFGFYLTQHIHHWLLDRPGAGPEAQQHFARLLDGL